MPAAHTPWNIFQHGIGVAVILHHAVFGYDHGRILRHAVFGFKRFQIGSVKLPVINGAVIQFMIDQNIGNAVVLSGIFQKRAHFITAVLIIPRAADHGRRIQRTHVIIRLFPRLKKVLPAGIVKIIITAVFIGGITDPFTEPHAVITLVKQAVNDLVMIIRIFDGVYRLRNQRKIRIFQIRAPVVGAGLFQFVDMIFIIIPGAVHILKINNKIIAAAGGERLGGNILHLTDRVLETKCGFRGQGGKMNAFRHIIGRHTILRDTV